MTHPAILDRIRELNEKRAAILRSLAGIDVEIARLRATESRVTERRIKKERAA